MTLKIRIFCYSNDLDIVRMLRKKIKNKQIQNIQSKSIRLENILAMKYYCVSIKIMTQERRQALSLQEFEELAKPVIEYLCPYD